MTTDPALSTLFLALDEMPDAGRAAFLRARLHPALSRLKDRLSCEQTFKPHADQLQAAGLSLPDRLEGPFDLILLLPTRSRDETLFDYARAFDLLAMGGSLLCAMPNNLGAGRFEGLLEQLAGRVGSLSKNKCRAFWARKTASLDQALLAEWRDLGRLRPVMDGRFLSRPGIFGWDKIDAGSQLLTETLPPAIAGTVADLGAGYGFLGDFLLRRHPAITRLDLFEAEKLALDAARANLARLEPQADIGYHWCDVTRGVGSDLYDWVVTNPPFHEGRAADPGLGQAFIAAAAQGLRPGGQLWLVANRQLPYEQALGGVLRHIHCAAERDGFKILTGTKA